MDIEGTANKFLNPVEKHSGLIGGGIAALQNLGFYMDDINQIMNGNIHAPEWTNILNFALNDQNSRTALIAAIGGYLLKDALPNATLKKLAEIAQKIGTAYYVVWVGSAAIFYSTHSPAMGSVQSQPQQTGQYTSRPLQGSTLNSSGMQNLAPYQSVYPNNPTAGTIYTAASGERLIGN